MNSKRPLLFDSLYRIKLLKAGFTGIEIEKLYILDNNLEFVGVNWCNCKKCIVSITESEQVRDGGL